MMVHLMLYHFYYQTDGESDDHVDNIDLVVGHHVAWGRKEVVAAALD